MTNCFRNVMKRDIFGKCVNKVIELLQGQVQQVETKSQRDVKVRIETFHRHRPRRMANDIERVPGRRIWEKSISQRAT